MEQQLLAARPAPLSSPALPRAPACAPLHPSDLPAAAAAVLCCCRCRCCCWCCCRFPFAQHALRLDRFADHTTKATWDYSAWIRVYSVYLDERLNCFRQIKLDPEQVK